jgi:tetratricopeptide (TPR) repeat protein
MRRVLTLTMLAISSLLIFASCFNKEYDEAIEKADAAFEKHEYVAAKTHYSKALELSPDEEYPKTQLEKVNKILAEIAAKKAAADEKEYKKLIEQADTFFGGKDYSAAKGQYEKASSIKPKEAYPKDQLAKINKIMAEEEAMKNYPYHIVLGAFEVDRNAVNYLALVKEKHSQHARKLKMGRLDAVTYKSYKTLTDAYNELPKAKQISENAWVVRR